MPHYCNLQTPKKRAANCTQPSAEEGAPLALRVAAGHWEPSLPQDLRSLALLVEANAGSSFPSPLHLQLQELPPRACSPSLHLQGLLAGGQPKLGVLPQHPQQASTPQKENAL